MSLLCRYSGALSKFQNHADQFLKLIRTERSIYQIRVEDKQEAGEDMIQLYDHNQTAYQSALDLLVETGKAAVVHPTGTGKSFIAFKLIEDNPDKSFVWLSLEAGFDYGTQVRPEEAVEEGERGGKSRHGKQFGGRVYFS